MKTKNSKIEKRLRLKKKIRTKIFGTEVMPRLSVYRSNQFIYAQLINDTTGKTLGSVSDIKIGKGTKTERAQEAGKMIADIAKKNNITKVVFDRNGFKYTGRIAALATSARANGLTF